MALLRLFWGFLGLENGLISWHTFIHAIYNYDHHILVLFRMRFANIFLLLKLNTTETKNVVSRN